MTEADFWPSYAYVPGLTPRHPEGRFDAITDRVRPEMSPQDLAQSSAFRMGLRYLDAGFYWEAHEMFEPIWMALPNPGTERQFVQGLIQIANGFLKLRMGRPKAAARLARIAQDLVPTGQGNVMGVQLIEVQGMVHQLGEQAENVL